MLTIMCDCANVPPTMPTCRDTHLETCPAAPIGVRLAWARDMLADPVRASVEMSGLTTAELTDLRSRF